MDAQRMDLLVEGYQRTLQEARERFGDSTETKIVVATVVEHARAVRRTLTTSVVGGDLLTGRIDAFLSEAETIDIVGRLLARAKQEATSVAETVAKQVLTASLTLSAPPVVASVIAAFVAWSGLLHGIGQSIGAGLAAAVTAALVFAQRAPGVAVRVVSVAGRSAASYDWGSSGFVRAVEWVDHLGRPAARLVEETLGPAARGMPPLGPEPPGWEIPARVRGIAKGVLYSAVAILVIAGIIVAFGIYDGWVTYTCQTNFTVPCP